MENVREHLATAIRQTPDLAVEEQDSLPEGAMLMGWVMVAEWMDPDGARWLTQVSGNASGDSLTTWQTQGYLHNALNDWPAPLVEDEPVDLPPQETELGEGTHASECPCCCRELDG